jgi:signal transduction histidine kinase
VDQSLSAAQLERTVSLLRLFGLVAGLLLISLSNFANGALLAVAWATMGFLAVATVSTWWWGRHTLWRSPALVHVGFCVDVLLILGYAVSFADIRPNVSWAVAFTVLADATLRYGVRGAALGYATAVLVVLVQAKAHDAAGGESTSAVGFAFVLSTLFGVSGVLGLFSHLLDRRAREQQDQALALADALELQERGVAAASQEFRGALAVIVGAAQTARQKRDRFDAEGLDSLLEDIEGQGRQIQALVDELLTTGADRLVGIRIQGRPDNVAATVRRGLMAAERHRRNHAVQLDLHPLTCTLDHERLQQAVRNLVDNAYQHTPPGTPVRVGVRRLGVTVELQVSDQGAGIPAVEQLRSQDPFVRRPFHSPSGGGGLGLYLVRQIVTAMGGVMEIHASSAGTSVAVRVPATEFGP